MTGSEGVRVLGPALVAAALTLGAAADARPSGAPTVAVVGAVAFEDDDVTALEDALARLAEAPEAARAELRSLVRRAPGALLAALEAETSIGADGLPRGARAAALADALAELSTGALGSLFAPTAETPVAARRARLAVVQRREGPEALELAVALADDGSDSGALGPALRSVATALHERSDAVGAALVGHVRRAPLALVEPLVRALADVHRPDTLPRLGDLIGAVPPVDPLLLGLVSRLAEGDPAHLDPRVAEAVRAALDAEDPAVRREAVNAAAHLADYEAVGTLIRRLEDEHVGVRDNARRALEQLSRLRLGPEVQRWRVWHELNRRWWREDWPRLEAELLTGDHDTVVEALRAVAGRRYHHHEIAAVVVRVLERTDDPHLLRYACLTLAALRSRPAAEALVPLLGDPRPTVRDSAHETLLRLTDLELPADPDLWAARLADGSAG